MTMTAMIVEDSRLARLELKEQLKNVADIELVAKAATVAEAQQLVQEVQPDIVFLDIQLPGGDGFEFLHTLSKPPLIVFTTAYSEYALQAFEFNAIDYLLKPIESERLLAAIAKCRDRLTANRIASEAPAPPKQFFIKDGERCYIVKLNEVRYFQGVGNYCQVYFADQHPMLLKPLNKLSEMLESQSFFRANRQQLINLDYVDHVEMSFKGRLDLTLSCGTLIEVSSRQSSRLRQLLCL